MFGPIKTIIFDMDGTLLDSMPGVYRAVREVMGSLRPGQSITDEEIQRHLGPPPREIFARMFPQEAEAAFAIWSRTISRLTLADFAPFDGVDEMLTGLAAVGVQMAILTGRDRAGTETFFKHVAWAGKYFRTEHVICGDDGPAPKPSPEGILELQKRMGFELSSTLMVGDHPADILAGQAAGCKTAAVLWEAPRPGLSQRAQYKAAWEKWEKIPCDLRLESPQSLLHWLGQ